MTKFHHNSPNSLIQNIKHEYFLEKEVKLYRQISVKVVHEGSTSQYFGVTAQPKTPEVDPNTTIAAVALLSIYHLERQQQAANTGNDN